MARIRPPQTHRLGVVQPNVRFSGGNADPSATIDPPAPTRPYTFGELIDMPFGLLQASIKTLAGLGAVGLVIGEALILAVSSIVSLAGGGGETLVRSTVIVTAAIYLWVLRTVLRGVATSTGLAAMGGRRLRWRVALADVRSHAGPFLRHQLMFTLVGLPFFLLVVGAIPWPALILTLPIQIWLGRIRARRYVAAPAIFAENVDYKTAVWRSKLLTAKNVGRLTWIWIDHRLLLIPVAYPLYAFREKFGMFTGTERWGSIALSVGAVILIVAIGEIVEANTRVLAYFDTRCRREGFDIRVPR